MERAEALEAGIRFMVWVFSQGHDYSDDVRRLFERTDMRWIEVQAARASADLAEAMRTLGSALAAEGKHIFHWFEIGRNTIFLSNMIGTGAPPQLIDAALDGYGRWLREAYIQFDQRDRIEEMLSVLGEEGRDDKASQLLRLVEYLRELAVMQDKEGLSVRPIVTFPGDFKMETVMGNVIKNRNGTVINQSNVINSMNAVGELHGKEIADALRELKGYIEKEGNEGAIVLIRAFEDEAAKKTPDKSRLKSLWAEITKIVPDITALAVAVGAIAKLFT